MSKMARTSEDLGIPKNERRILLIGKSGVGKSTVGNYILGKPAFKTECGANPIDQKTESQTAQRNEESLLVVDTPGLNSTIDKNEKVMFEIAKCHITTCPGLHGIVLVLKVGIFSPEDEETVELVLTYFGENVTKYMVVAFTHEDDLTTDNRTIEQYVDEIDKNSYVYKLLNRINFRYVAFCLKDENSAQKVTRLLEIMYTIVKENNNNYYTIEMFKEATNILKKRWEDEGRRLKEKTANEIKQAKIALTEEHEKKMVEVNSKINDDKEKYSEVIKKVKQDKANVDKKRDELETKLKNQLEEDRRLLNLKDKEHAEKIEEMQKQHKQLMDAEKQTLERKLQDAKNQPGGLFGFALGVITAIVAVVVVKKVK